MSREPALKKGLDRSVSVPEWFRDLESTANGGAETARLVEQLSLASEESLNAPPRGLSEGTAEAVRASRRQRGLPPVSASCGDVRVPSARFSAGADDGARPQSWQQSAPVNAASTPRSSRRRSERTLDPDRQTGMPQTPERGVERSYAEQGSVRQRTLRDGSPVYLAVQTAPNTPVGSYGDLRSECVSSTAVSVGISRSQRLTDISLPRSEGRLRTSAQALGLSTPSQLPIYQDSGLAKVRTAAPQDFLAFDGRSAVPTPGRTAVKEVSEVRKPRYSNVLGGAGHLAVVPSGAHHGPVAQSTFARHEEDAGSHFSTAEESASDPDTDSEVVTMVKRPPSGEKRRSVRVNPRTAREPAVEGLLPSEHAEFLAFRRMKEHARIVRERAAVRKSVERNHAKPKPVPVEKNPTPEDWVAMLRKQSEQQATNNRLSDSLLRRHENLARREHQFNSEYSAWCDSHREDEQRTQRGVGGPEIEKRTQREVECPADSPDRVPVRGQATTEHRRIEFADTVPYHTRGPSVQETTFGVSNLADTWLEGRRISREEKHLLSRNPALAELYVDHSAQGGGAAFAAYTRDRLLCETHIPRREVLGAARVTAVPTKPFDGKTSSWEVWWRGFVLDMRSNRWSEDQALSRLLMLLNNGPAQGCVDTWSEKGCTSLDELLQLLSFRFRARDELAAWTQWLKRVQTPKDGPYSIYGLQLQTEGRAAGKGTGMSDRLIERHVVEQFASTLRDPGEQEAAMRALIPGISTLDDLFVAVEAHRVKTHRLNYRPTSVAVVACTAEPTDSDGEAVVAAYANYRAKRPEYNKPREQNTKFGGRSSLAKDIAKEVVSQTTVPKEEPQRLGKPRGYTRADQYAQRQRNLAPQECARCHALGHWATTCPAPSPRTVEDARRAGNNNNPRYRSDRPSPRNPYGANVGQGSGKA